MKDKKQPNSAKGRNTSQNNNASNISNNIAIASGWIEAIGTILSAIGSTPSTTLSQKTLNDLNLIGNVLQAWGSALAAETEDVLLDIVGDELSALGNIVVVAGILDPNKEMSQLLSTQGNLLQILGTGITIDTEGNLSLVEAINNIGNIIQIIGNTIQVLADPNTEEGVELNAIGNWIQAVGSVISAIAVD